MKTFNTVLLLFISLTSLFSQEFIKNSKVHLKDNLVISGDFYYYPSLPNSIEVVDSIGTKQIYQISEIDFIESKSSLLRSFKYNGKAKLFSSIVEGDKISLYKTDINEEQQFYALKGDQILWLKSGTREIKIKSKVYSKEIDSYKGILKFLVNDNAFLFKKIDGITYTEKDISDIIIAYNNGHISYFKNEVIENQNRISDWKFYSQFSNYSSEPFFTENTSASSFMQIGGELFVSEGSRHSFKFGLEYGKFEDENYESWDKYLNVNVSYLYDFYRMPKSNFYLGIRFFDIAKIWDNTDNDLSFVPRLSPSFGFEYHINNYLDIYVEVNHIFKLADMPYNFSIGLSYDI